ncbi:unnamed protein product [Vicia faba]|uniref:NB-ARC domain-containing protein n=1 Tax=Vicia faba TaxID=3906 RepID=A0AAV0ZF37_VICFA|nr:unnamed protein product [Vicia faba]
MHSKVIYNHIARDGWHWKNNINQKSWKRTKRICTITHVIDVKMSFTPNIKKIQDDIAQPLEMEWYCKDSERSRKLLTRLSSGENDEKILLIMDDVWDQDLRLDFDLIGIPKEENLKGCKVLITTQSTQIFTGMHRSKMIQLELLTEEEAWAMFKTYAGIGISSLSKKLIEKSRKISKECKQLLIAVAVMTKNLKGQHPNKWDDTLRSLSKHVAVDDVDEEKVGVYKCFKSSYDYIWDKKAKRLFLLSSLFPLDKDIPIEILTRLSFGTSLFEEAYDIYNNARSKVYEIKNNLINSCLLLRVNDEHVRMHNLVHEVAQWIAKNEIQCVNLSNKDQKSSLERQTNIKYLFCTGKDKDLFSCQIDGSKLEILIVDMEREEYPKCVEFMYSFFEKIVELQVLYVLGHEKRDLSLPQSIRSLAVIRSILIDGVDLGDIFVLGNLQSLETLDLDKCKINELPKEIAKFKNFRLLNMVRCVIRRVIHLRYRIGKKWEWSRDSWLLSKCVAFTDHNCFLSKETYKYCMQTSDALQLNGISIKEGWRNLMPEIVDIPQGMNVLVELRISEISQLQCLIDANDFQDPKVLSKLVVLELDKMKILEVLFKGSLSSDSLMLLEELSIFKCEMLQRLSNFKLNLCKLKKVVLFECPRLVNLSSLLTSLNLRLLEKLEIRDCEKLTSIIIDGRGENELREEIDNNDNDNKKYVSMFPELKNLVIEGCHLVESILPLLSSRDLPELETLKIKECNELKYIFRKCQHVEKGSLKHILLWQFPKLKEISVKNCLQLEYIFGHYIDDDHQNYNGIHLDLPALECLNLQLQLKKCSLDNAIMKFLHTWEHAQCLPLQSNIMRNVKEMTLSGFEYIIVDIGDDESGVNNLVNVFPKLKRLYVRDCKQFKYIFGHYTERHRYDNEIHLHLPTLQSLELCNLPCLVAICPKRYCTTFSSLKDLKIVECFMDNKIMQELDKEQPTSQQGLKTQQDTLEEINTKDKPSQELSGSMEHCIALKSLFVDPENSFYLQNLTQIIIVGRALRRSVLHPLRVKPLSFTLSAVFFVTPSNCHAVFVVHVVVRSSFAVQLPFVVVYSENSSNNNNLLRGERVVSRVLSATNEEGRVKGENSIEHVTYEEDAIDADDNDERLTKSSNASDKAFEVLLTMQGK